jgi:hypothetical protein
VAKYIKGTFLLCLGREAECGGEQGGETQQQLWGKPGIALPRRNKEQAETESHISSSLTHKLALRGRGW